jgi:hypothetical protein
MMNLDTKNKVNEQLNRTSSMVVSVRVDLRTVAVLHKFFTDIDIHTKGVSELLRLACEQFSDVLLTKQEVIRPSIREAIDYLTENTNWSLQNANERTKRSVIKQLQVEAMVNEGFADQLNYLQTKRQGPRLSEADLANMVEQITTDDDDEATLNAAIAGRLPGGSL